MKNLRSFNVLFVGPTNTKPARVRIRDNRFKVTTLVSYHNDISERIEIIANEYLLSKGIVCSFMSQDKKGFILLTNNFKDSIL